MKQSGNDLTIYEDHAHEWWVPGSFHFASLQNITPFRLELLNEICGDLKGKQVLDLGCGGGLLAVPLINQGAELTGVDLSPASIAEARRASGGRGNFIAADLKEYHPPEESFDLVLLADVVDHIAEYDSLIERAAKAVKKDGKVFVSTINRTLLSRFFAITLGEGLKLIPPGTHDWRMFVKPAELFLAARKAGLKSEFITGEWPIIFKSLTSGVISVRRSNCLQLGYAAVFSL